jgi:RNA polymerase sigma-70 factor (ECF subfamily)
MACNQNRFQSVLLMNTMNKDLFWKSLEAEHPGAERFCRKLAANRDDGDDLYQDVLLLAWRKFGKLRDLESFKPWLYRIIVNLYKSKCRKRGWAKRVVIDQNDYENQPSHNPTSSLSARIWIDRMFRALSAEDRALVSLFELEGWSIADLSRLYGKREGTIKSRLSRARGNMRVELARYINRQELNTLIGEAEYALPRSNPPSE